ncbi:unnamed protein product [Adineta steineri]|uniref:NAD(P)(+)--arginine ADP-ribosyltransferase n=1 Tax=Adineta steineri TaxID=433720 RepID=A0A814Q992_9BILA|nr:unnamed protein product [Adineta steineri]CAF3957515.1 unnamed protein product [Adineta steineri]
MTHNRFVNSALSELEEANQSPIYGYQHLPLLTLEESIEKLIPLVPGITDYVSTAKKQCNRSSSLLTNDESAAIYLYSMSISFFSCLNEVLRAERRHTLKPWFFYLKLFITALEKLPSIRKTVWRGIPIDISSNFTDGDVHIWWSVNSCSMNPNIIQPFLGDKGTLFIIETINGKDITMFSAFPVEQEIVLMPGTRLRVKSSSFNHIDRLFVIPLEETDLQNESQSTPGYLSELMKLEYQQHHRIELIMNPSKSFPIQQSYINLAIVETKEQKEKEKKLLNTKHSNDEIISTFEEIYDTKTLVEVEDMFKICKNQTKRLLVFGRAGIGKTTFCQYVAHQWAIGAIWQQYQLAVFIRLRNLTEWRYPLLTSGARYSLIDIVKTEYLHHDLTDKYETLLKEELNNNQILWLLDGYDEIAQNIPLHLKYLLEQLLKTPHHILTSRPYLNTLSYDVQMEITGFTDDNITKYVKQFFDQTNDEMGNASIQTENLLNFLRCNVRIWGIAHIPVTLELICSLWCDTDWSETTTLTITVVYDKMIEWICRRHLEKHNISSNQMTKEDVYQHLHKELAFLECLAFNAMERKTIIISPIILRIALKQSECSLQHQSHLLNIGVLKSLDYKPIGTILEADKNHYFVHLSFQEYFTARYLVKALDGACDQKKKAIDFIKTHNVSKFISVLPITHSYEALIQLHITALVKKAGYLRCSVLWPLARLAAKAATNEIIHRLINLLDDTNNEVRKRACYTLGRMGDKAATNEVIHRLIHLLDDPDNKVTLSALEALLKLDAKEATNEAIHRLISLLNDTNNNVRESAFGILVRLDEKAAKYEAIHQLISLLNDTDSKIRESAFGVLLRLGEKATTNETIHRLLRLLDDTDNEVRKHACSTLGAMGDKVATSEMIHRLINLLDDADYEVRKSACHALGRMDNKATTNEVIHKLISLLDDTDNELRKHVCSTLGSMGDKAATNEVIHKLISLLDDTDNKIKESACYALVKMGDKAAIDEVIHKFISLLDDTDYGVKKSACYALGEMHDKAAKNGVIYKLILLLDDTDCGVRKSACYALVNMGDEAATNEVIHRLIRLLGDTDNEVRDSAGYALVRMGDKVSINEVIHQLISLISDAKYEVRKSACSTLGRIGDKAATNEVIHRVISLLDDTDSKVKESACHVLLTMGGKAVTDEVISKIFVMFRYEEIGIWAIESMLTNIFGSLSCMSSMKHDAVQILSNCVEREDVMFRLKNGSEKFIQAYVITGISYWLPIIKKICFTKGYALTVDKETITVYGSEVPVQLPLPNEELGQTLRNYFVNWPEESLQSYNRVVK